MRSKKMVVPVLAAVLIVGAAAFLPLFPQPVHAQLEDIVGAILGPILGEFGIVEDVQQQVLNIVQDIQGKTNAILGLTNSILGLLQDGDFGLEAIDDEVETNTQLLTDDDFGLEAVDDEVEFNTQLLTDDDFGLDAQVNDGTYGQKRIAADVAEVLFNVLHFDWGLEVIDDEIEVIDAKISKQLAKQRVEISVTRSENSWYLQTHESGKPVDVDFVNVTIVRNGAGIPLTSGEFTATRIDTGLYRFKTDVRGDVDGIYIVVQHPEDPIVHASLPEPIPVDHFGAILIAPNGEKGAAQ